MKLPNFSGLYQVGKAFVQARRPEILFGAAIAATVGSTVLAAKGGYEARGLVDAKRAETGEEPTNKEKIQLTWLCYMPAAIVCTTAVGSITGLHLVHVKEKKALAATALAAIEEIKKEGKEYSDGLLKQLDDEVPDEEKERVQKELNERGPAPEWITDEKLYPVMDEYTGRIFYANETRIQNAVNEVNKKLNKDGNCDLNTFYMWAGIDELDRGVEEGWSGKNISVTWDDEHIRTTGEPVRKFIFRSPPQKGFESAHAQPEPA